MAPSFFNRLCVSFFLVLPGLASVFAEPPVPDEDNGGLVLPAGFRALIVADNLMAGRAGPPPGRGDMLRFLAVAPNGDLYGRSFVGGIFALRDTDGDGRADERHEFGEGGGTGVAVRGDWLYYSTNQAVYRYARAFDQLVPSGPAELIVGGLKDEGTHNAKAFAFDDQGNLLVEVGSPYNVYSDGDRAFGAKGKDATEFLKTCGGFWRFGADRPGQTMADGVRFSTGHRHSVALAWQPVGRTFYMAMMGRDQMNVIAPEYYDALDNAERVAEEMHRLREGADLGWPYTYWDPIKKARMVSPEFGGDNRKRAVEGRYSEPVIAFPAHWAPLQMAFYAGEQFPARYRNGAFIAFHGSWNRAPLAQEGYNIAFVPFDEKGEPGTTYEVFARAAGGTRFRMGGVAVGPDGSLYVSETDRGRIWRIIYTGNAPAASVSPKATVAVQAIDAPKPVSTANAAGKKIYTQMCAMCHMADGAGAGQMQPPLKGSAVVNGDAGRLIQLVVRGPAAVLPADRPKYANQMPAFPTLRDQQIADLVNYLRQEFGDGASAITSAQVARLRK